MKMKQYPKYKDSGVPWIDRVPENWDVLPNRAVFEERNTRGMDREDLLSVTIKRGVIKQKELIKTHISLAILSITKCFGISQTLL